MSRQPSERWRELDTSIPCLVRSKEGSLNKIGDHFESNTRAMIQGEKVQHLFWGEEKFRVQNQAGLGICGRTSKRFIIGS